MSGTVQTADVNNRKYIGGTQPGYRHVDSTGHGLLIKSNLNAAVAPLTSDDALDGYAVGSEWINTVTGTIYKCVDPTPAVSVWKDLSSSPAPVTPAGVGTELQYRNGSSFGAITGSSWDGTTLSIPNLTVTGTTTTINAVNLSVSDSLIKLANQNTADLLDIGFYGQYSSTSFTGLFRDATDGKYRLFTGLTVEPTTTVNIVGAGYTAGTLVVGMIESTTYTGLPVASNVLAGIVSTGTQTFAGEKTIIGDLVVTPSSGTVVVKVVANGNSNGWSGTTSNHPYLFRAAGTNYAAIDTTGKFGINILSSIGAQLHVVQSVVTTPVMILQQMTSSSVTILQLKQGLTPGANAHFLTCTTSGGVEGDLAKIDKDGLISSYNGFSPALNSRFYAVSGRPSLTDGQGNQAFSLGSSPAEAAWLSKTLAWGTNYFTHDTGLLGVAGVVQVNNGTTGTYRDIRARLYYFGGQSSYIDGSSGAIDIVDTVPGNPIRFSTTTSGGSQAVRLTIDPNGAALFAPTGTTTVPITVTGVTSHSVPLLKINMGATPTGNVIDVFTSAAASVFSVSVAGVVNAQQDIVTQGSIVLATYIRWSGATRLQGGLTDGRLQLLNNAANNFDMLQLGGVTAAEPAIKRNAAGIDFVLANDSGFCNIAAAAGTFTGAMRFGTHVGNIDAPITGYVTIKDSGGTDRKLAVIA